MKIALIAPPWLPVPPRAYGGTEAVVDRLARGLHAAGHDVVLWASGDSGCPVPRRAPLSAAQPDLMGQTIPELFHAVAAYGEVGDADIVHDHTVLGAFAAPSSARVVVTNHGPFDAMLRPIFEAIARRASVVAISHVQARAAVPGTIRAVIHHGLDPGSIPVGSGSGGYLAHVGRMSPDKGVVQAIAVAERAGLPLLIAGKCRDRAEVEFFDAAVRPRLGRDVEYVGEVDETAKYALMGDALAFLNPIQWEEPFGLVMIEALATGTPVLSTARGAAPEIVESGRTGWLADSVEALALAVREAVALDRGACRLSVEQRFSTTRMVERHLALYLRLLDSPTSEAADGVGSPAA